MGQLQITPELALAIEREACQRSLATFVRQAWHVLEPNQPYVHGWHIELVCAHLEAITRGDINRLLINVPPGTMKSMLVSVFWPAWEWGPKRLPSTRYVTASHAEDFAIRDTLSMRRLVTSDWYQKRWPIALFRDQNEKKKFQNIDTGFRQSMAMRSLTGTRGDRVIIDDPHSVEGAISDTERRTTLRVFTETVPSRLNNPDRSAIVVVMQRLHEQDVSGFILSGANRHGYTHVCLPMEFDPARKCITPFGEDPRTEPGELLFPDRFPRAVVERDKLLMGRSAVAGQFQQTPIAEGGNVFAADGVQYYLPKDLPAKFDKIICSWDCTFKDSEGTDYVVGQAWGKRGADSYLLAQRRARMGFTKTVEEVINLRKQFSGCREILIEDKANGPAVIDVLKKSVPGIIPVEPDGSKLARAHAVTAFWEARNVWLPHPSIAPWVDDLVGELKTFPAAAHDDQVDALTQALRRLYPLKGRLTISQSLLDQFGVK